MKAFINQQLILQTVLDSGELAMLGAVIHSFPEPGEYHGAVLKGKQLATTFHLTIDEQSSAMQVDIDLAALTQPSASRATTPCECKDEKKPGEPERAPHFTVNPRGQTLFYVSQGTGGYAVQVNRVNERRILFDSRELQEGDLFAATLIRPGSYAVTNAPARSKGEVIVAYPEPGKTAYHPPEPVTIEATDTGLIVVAGDSQTKLDKLGIKAAQGQLYRIRTPSRIRIELLKPDDGPKEKPPASIFTWRKQALPGGQQGRGPRDRQVGGAESGRARPKAPAKAPRKKKS